MRSRTTKRFRRCFAELPEPIKRQAREAYRRFVVDPNHPGLRFKRVHSTEPVYSVRISLDYRALGVLDRDEIIWFWIGAHDDYQKLLAQL